MRANYRPYIIIPLLGQSVLNNVSISFTAIDIDVRSGEKSFTKVPTVSNCG